MEVSLKVADLRKFVSTEITVPELYAEVYFQYPVSTDDEMDPNYANLESTTLLF